MQYNSPFWYDKEEAISILQDFAKDLGREIEIIENPFWCL
jgi:hypothetical protein